jgi:methylenetetrahydrofolate reductase (NADPH)
MKQNLFGTIIPDEMIARLDAAQDPAAEGLGICVELIEQLAQTPGIAGVHVMAPGNDTAVPEVLAEVRRRLPPGRQSKARVATDTVSPLSPEGRGSG